ncbi:hypothetical protein WA158_007442 [Blastocystis sp. Blastoise]
MSNNLSFLFRNTSLTCEEVQLSLKAIKAFKNRNIKKYAEKHIDGLQYLWANNDYSGYVSMTEKYIIVAFRGTNCIEDLYNDLDCSLIPFYNGYCHRGFYNLAHSINIDLVLSIIDTYPEKSVLLCGHSMGGAASLILYYELCEYSHSESTKVFTLGAPFCLSMDVCHTNANMFNIMNMINVNDPVPLITNSKRHSYFLNSLYTSFLKVFHTICEDSESTEYLLQYFNQYDDIFRNTLKKSTLFSPQGYFFLIYGNRQIKYLSSFQVVDYIYKNSGTIPSLWQHIVWYYIHQCQNIHPNTLVY